MKYSNQSFPSGAFQPCWVHFEWKLRTIVFLNAQMCCLFTSPAGSKKEANTKRNRRKEEYKEEKTPTKYTSSLALQQSVNMCVMHTVYRECLYFNAHINFDIIGFHILCMCILLIFSYFSFVVFFFICFAL